jgi:anaerobic magnesium-protoporphyrin IX monomethyl ester cyclase
MSTRGKKSGAMLVFPPVWVPMVPHLALPALTAYLREHGYRVVPVDANLHFFVDHLLTTDTLQALAGRIESLLHSGNLDLFPDAQRERLLDEFPKWQQAISEVRRILEVFRSEQTFFSPDILLRAQNRLQGFLRMATLAQWPGRLSFNHYHRGDIRTAEDLLDLCRDPDRNVFLPFFRDRILPQIRDAAPLILGISISSIHQFIAAMTLAHLVRQEVPGIHITVGGKHLLRIRDKLLENAFYFRRYFHSAVLHEGEKPLAALLDTVGSSGDLDRVPNLIHLKGDQPVATPPCEPIALDRLPHPDFSDLPWDRYLTPRRYAPIRTAEGCYWGKCTFCARYGPQRTAFMDPARVVDVLEHLNAAYGVRDVSVNDDCLPPQYWEQMCRLILERGLDLSMLIWAKPVSGFTAERLHLMARAGVHQIRWGVESAHPRILKRMHKGTTVQTTVRVLQESHAAGIWNHACFILGFPTESRGEAQRTLDFIAHHRTVIQSFILYSFILYENSYIFHHPKEFGIRDIRRLSTPFFDHFSYATDQGMGPREVRSLLTQGKTHLLDEAYEWPFWYYLKLREYLQLYLDRFGLAGVRNLSFDRRGLRRTVDDTDSAA